MIDWNKVSNVVKCKIKIQKVSIQLFDNSKICGKKITKYFSVAIRKRGYYVTSPWG